MEILWFSPNYFLWPCFLIIIRDQINLKFVFILLPRHNVFSLDIWMLVFFTTFIIKTRNLCRVQTKPRGSHQTAPWRQRE